MANIIKGEELMLFDSENKSLGFATAHTLTISADAVDISSKDHGRFKGSNINSISWEITSENLYTVAAYDSLFEKMVAREAIKVYFGTKKENDPDKTVADGDFEYWTGASGYAGNAFITSLTANANNGENATFSVTLTGTGKISKVTTIPVVTE